MVTLGLTLRPEDSKDGYEHGERDYLIIQTLAAINPDIGEAILETLAKALAERPEMQGRLNSRDIYWRLKIAREIDDDECFSIEDVIDDLAWGGEVNCFRFTEGDRDWLVSLDSEQRVEEVFLVDTDDPHFEKVGLDKAIVKRDGKTENVLLALQDELSNWELYHDDPHGYYISLDVKNKKAAEWQANEAQSKVSAATDLTPLFLGRSGGHLCISDWQPEELADPIIKCICDSLTVDELRAATAMLTEIRSQVDSFLEIGSLNLETSTQRK